LDEVVEDAKPFGVLAVLDIDEGADLGSLGEVSGWL